MKVCYVDESGCLGSLPSSTSPVQPVLVLTGLFLDHESLHDLTREFLDLKGKFFPNRFRNGGHYLDRILTEIKGADLRKDAASNRRREWRQAITFLDRFLGLLESHDARIVSRIWVKGVAVQFNGQAAYAYSIQTICSHFQRYLEASDEIGFVVADSRCPHQNQNVSHSIFTQKFRSSGDSYGRVVEMPMFGDSKNHAGIQIAGLLTSAILQPMAINAYCDGIINSDHVRSGYARIRQRYNVRLKSLQYRYFDKELSKWAGGITVNDALQKRSALAIFRP